MYMQLSGPRIRSTLRFYIQQLENDRQKAWDCATGNGQVARYLADYFDEVYATDISQQQLDNAIQKE